jgi:uncharacterized damage-inducible protein DinB
MSMIEQFSKELEQEAHTTRRMLERVPDDKLDWQPHPKSMNIRNLATHIAELPSWFEMTLCTEELDFAQNPYTPEKINNREELLAYFEQCVAKGQKQLATAREEELAQPWTLREGETVYSTSPKSDVMRMALNQIVHHRAQLGVYLRLLDIPIPGSYGPSADEQSFG